MTQKLRLTWFWLQEKKRLYFVGLFLVLAALILIFWIQSAKGAAYTWDGGGVDGTCGGGGTANNWSCAANWSSDITPGASDTVTFDGTSTKDATINGTVSVAGMTIASGYSGTITQSGSNTLTVGTSGFSQAAGTFTGGSGSITSSTSFTISGGTFTSTTGTATIGAFTHTAGGTFAHNNGTVLFNGNGLTTDVATTETFYNLTVGLSASNATRTIASGDTLIVLNTFAQTAGSLNTGDVEVRGNMTAGSITSGGSATVSFLVAGDQTITSTGSGGTGRLVVNKPSGTVTLSGTSFSALTFTLSSGTFTSTSGTFSVGGNGTTGWTHTAGGTFNHNNGTVAIGGTSHIVDVSTTETFYSLSMNLIASNQTMTVSSGDTLIVLNTFTQGVGILGTGRVEVRTALVISSASANGGSGTIDFLDGGDQTITASAAGSLPNVNIAKSGGTVTASGTFSVASFTQSSGAFDGGTGTITVTTTYTLSGGTFTSTTGILSVTGAWTHTAGGTFTHNSGTVRATIANATTTTWDVASTETFNNLTISNSNGSNSILAVASGDTFIVLGTLAQTTGIINTGTVEVRGNMTVGSNGGVGTAAISFLVDGDQTITSSGGGTSILNINKSTGTVSIPAGANLSTGGVVLTSGTFTSTTGILTISSGNWTHTAGGTFNHNNGTVTTSAGGAVTFDVDTSETFYNLIITGTDFNRNTTISSNDTLIVTNTFTHTTTSLLTGTVQVNGSMAVGSSITGSNVSTATILFNQTGDQTITSSGGGTAILNIAKASGTVTLSGNLTPKGFTQSSATFVAGTGTFTLSGNFWLTGGTFTSTSGTFSLLGTWTHSGGAFNHNSGTLSLDHTGATTWVLDFPVTESFNNFTVNGQDLNRIFSIATGDIAIVNGTYTHTNGVMNGSGVIQALGNVVINSGADGGSGALVFAGTADQTFNLPGPTAFNGDMTVDKGAGKVTFVSGATFDQASQDLTVTNGTVDLGTANIVTFSGTGGSVVIGTNGILQGTGTGGSLILAVTVTNNGTVYLNSNGPTCGDADSIQIRSTVGGSQRSWNGSGKFVLADLDIRDQGGSATIVTSSSNSVSGNGANWTYNATCPSLITAPNGSESWGVRTSQNITYSAYSGVDHYRLYYSTNSGASWTEIGTTASTTYDWTVPAINSTRTRILVQAEDSGNTILGSDISDADFTIAATGTQFNGGVILNGGITF